MNYVRIPRSVVHALRAYHVMSALSHDGTGNPNEIRGLTEWGAHWQDERLSIRWMWGFVRDVVIILDPARIETNIVLVTDDERLEPQLLATIHLLEWIESLPWREAGIPELLDECGVIRR